MTKAEDLACCVCAARLDGSVDAKQFSDLVGRFEAAVREEFRERLNVLDVVVGYRSVDRAKALYLDGEFQHTVEDEYYELPLMSFLNRHVFVHSEVVDCDSGWPNKLNYQTDPKEDYDPEKD